VVQLGVGLALLAALIHATWNVLVKTADNPLRELAWAMAAIAAATSPLAAAIWWLSGRPGLPVKAGLLVALSAILETIYVIFLSQAYRAGELSVVYPIARGTAPVLAVVAGFVVLEERLSLLQLAGVACLLTGILAVRQPARGPAVRLAVMTGVSIAGYSLVDRAGVRLGPPLLYGWVLMVLTTALVLAWAYPRGALRPRPTGWLRLLAVGAGVWPGYFLILYAYSLAPLSVISPVRESAVVLVSAWGIWRLHEHRGARLRLIGAAAVLAGIALLGLSSG